MMVGVYPKLSVSLFEVERSSDQFIDGLHPQLLSHAISCVDPIDGEVVNQPHFVGLLQRESLCNALRFAVVRWVKPALLNLLPPLRLQKSRIL